MKNPIRYSHDFLEASLSMRRPQGLMGTIAQFVHSLAEENLDPVPGWTCAQEAFPVVLSLMAYRIWNIAKSFWVNQQGSLEKQLDPGR